jgi:hypothetical protein
VSSSPSPLPSDEADAGWQRLPNPPLSPREDALGVYVDGLALMLGGSNLEASGPVFVPPLLRDGAALDLSTRTWHPIATAPWAPAESAAHIVVGDRVLLARNGRGGWMTYDVTENAWSSVPAPPVAVPQPTMAVQGHRVFVLDKYVDESPAPVQILNLTKNTWSTLPASTHRPAIDDRTVVFTSSGLVVMGSDLSPRQAGEHTQPALAEIWNGTGWVRFQSDHVAGDYWQWTGQRVISTYRGTSRVSARGGLHEFRAAAFDPATRTWKRLPWLPTRQSGLLEDTWPSSDAPRVLSRGYLYDDLTRESIPITSPSDWYRRTQLLTDGAVVLFGGAKPKPGQTRPVIQLRLTNEAWILPLDRASLSRQLTTTHPTDRQPPVGGISAEDLAKATHVARQGIASAQARVYSATVTATLGKQLTSNTGHACTSGRLLHIKLIGSFPHTVTTGHPVEPGQPTPDFTVRAMIITADAGSGLACRIGVQTREHGEPQPQPNATVLDLH